MDFSLSSEQKQLKETVRQFISDHLEPLEESVERSGRLDPVAAVEIQQMSRKLGLYAVNMPAELGGGGLSTLDWILMEEEFGRTTDILIRRAFGNVYDILLAGTEAQQKRWLIPCISGERVCSIAFTEPEAGSDAAAVRTTAKVSGSGWVLSGGKCFISDAHVSDFFVVSASTGNGGISIFMVDKDLPGFSIGPDQPMMGLRGTTHAELFFDSVKLEADCLLGKEGEGLKLALNTLGGVRLAQIGARSVGRSGRILERMLKQASERIQFGKPLAEFQQVQKMLADSTVELASARLLLRHTAWLKDQGHDVRTQTSMVKLNASETLGRIADRAVQVFGGSGYSKGDTIERHYRDARVYRIFDGTSEVHRWQISKGLADPASNYLISGDWP